MEVGCIQCFILGQLKDLALNNAKKVAFVADTQSSHHSSSYSDHPYWRVLHMAKEN
jgi:hypothetical protein